MKTYNDTTYAVLGILTTSCKSGYAIKQFIDRSLNHFWKISYGQLYPALNFIVEEGLATVNSANESNKHEKKEYHLTPKSIDVLKSWLEQPIKQIPSERNEILLKLFFGRFQDKAKQLQLIEHYCFELNKRYHTYLAIEQFIQAHEQDSEDAMYWILTLDYGKRTTLAAIEWCEATIQLIAKENKDNG